MGWLQKLSNRTRLALLAGLSAGISALALQLITTVIPLPIPLLLLLSAIFTGALTLIGYRASHRPVVQWADIAPEELLANPSAIAQIATGDDELGALLEIFEGLLEQIQHQDKVMQAYNEELEMQVDKRTKELQRQADYVRNTLDSMAEALFATGPNGVIQSVNRAAAEITGYTADELIGRYVDTLFFSSVSELENDNDWLSQVREGQRLSNDERWLMPQEGDRVPVLFSAASITDSTGRHQGIVCLALDITARKQFENELAQARDEAVEATRLKSEFLATMSHEIRTPMNGIMGLTSLMLDTDLNEEQREFAESATSCSKALMRIINDILDFSKIEAGEMRIEVVDFNLPRIIEDVAELLADRAQEKGIEMVCSIDRALPRWIRGDPGRLRQILTNLVGNAVKFTEEGVVQIGAEITAETEETYQLKFSIRDTGIGINEEARKKLFQSFSQADGSTTRQYGGTGLGLAISRKLCELMGGTIDVESELGKGSTFWFTTHFEKPDSSLRGVDLSLSPFSGREVLVVAQEQTFRATLREKLEQWGLLVHEAQSGIEASVLISDASQRKITYDMALVELPVQHDGKPLWQTLCSADDSPVHKLTLITTQNERASLQSSDLQTVHAALTKPIREQQLYECFARLAQQGQQDAAAIAGVDPSGAPANERSLKILVVDDNQDNQLVACRILEKLSCSVDLANDGAQAVNMASSHAYDLILMDCQMPVMDGFEATAQIRSHPSIEIPPPIVAMTANALEGDRDRCIAAGMDGYIDKPISADDLQAALAKWTRAVH